MASHSRILAWRIPRTEEFAGIQSTGSQESHDSVTKSPPYTYPLPLVLPQCFVSVLQLRDEGLELLTRVHEVLQ